MYQLKIVDVNSVVVHSQIFMRQIDIITFTKSAISYNDFKPRTHPKKYLCHTYKNYFQIEKM